MVDSGVGGLTVIKEAQKQLPNEQFIFIGDTARMPYGQRPVDEVIAYTLQMANYLMTEKHIKLLVIACNTATAAALPQLQLQLSIPVIGVIQPGAEAAALRTKNKKIGLIATAGTVNSKAYENQIADYGQDITLMSQAEPDFVQLVESNHYKTAIAQKVVSEHLATFKETAIDTLILGCTHFPLLSSFIQVAVGPEVQLIDAGRETVNLISSYLDTYDLKSEIKYQHDNDTYYTTSDPEMFKLIATQWLERHNELDVRHLNIIGTGEAQHLEGK